MSGSRRSAWSTLLPMVLAVGSLLAIWRWLLSDLELVPQLILLSPLALVAMWAVCVPCWRRQDLAFRFASFLAPFLLTAVFLAQSARISNYADGQRTTYYAYLVVCFLLSQIALQLGFRGKKPYAQMLCWAAIAALYLLRIGFMPIQFGVGVENMLQPSENPLRNIANSGLAVFLVLLGLTIVETTIYYGTVRKRATVYYIARRFLYALPLLLGMSFIAYSIISLSPGDYFAKYRLNPQYSEELIARLEQQHHYDKPYIVRYCYWLMDLTEGNLGYSLERRLPVTSVIRSAMLNTMLLNIVAISLSWTVAIPVGIYAAVKRYTWPERLLSFSAFVGICTPTFFLCLLLLLLATLIGAWLTALLLLPVAYIAARVVTAPLDVVAWRREGEGAVAWRPAARLARWIVFALVAWLFFRWGSLPSGGMTSADYSHLSPFGKVLDIAKHMVIPAFVLGFHSVAGLQRLMRGNMLETLRKQYITTARAKGLPENTVVYSHALRNAINPMVTILGMTFASLLSGAALTEIICSWPGLGSIMLEAVQKKDIHLVMGNLLIGGFLLIMGNLLADILLAQVDPRVRYS